MDLLWSTEPIDEVLEKSDLNKEVRHKLELARKAKRFAIEELGLDPTDNYEDYVQLDRPYVTWVVSASDRHQLRKYRWWFPIIGEVPYKGYFTKEEARELAKELEDDGYDTHVRGVSAYSTLGWFSDPILSSMLRYREHTLVDTIIHEMVHTTVYINSHSEFNEQLATFVADVGTRRFYREQPEVLERISRESSDRRVFAEFIKQEIRDLRKWYQENPQSEAAKRRARLDQINSKFKTELHIHLLSDRYDWFGEAKLNNARLLAMGTYVENLSDFERVFKKMDQNMRRFLAAMEQLEDSEDPMAELSQL